MMLITILLLLPGDYDDDEGEKEEEMRNEKDAIMIEAQVIKRRTRQEDDVKE